MQASLGLRWTPAVAGRAGLDLGRRLGRDQRRRHGGQGHGGDQPDRPAQGPDHLDGHDLGGGDGAQRVLTGGRDVVAPDPQGTGTNAAMPAVGLAWCSMASAPLECGERRWPASER
jgi:hypothetical protein